ncbi:MAG TPA: hypothetical protein VKU90_07795 [Caulobacteraceae bacterium]|nr:hypothetical protein [Caulobacteraceae bacterium]
MRIVEDTPQRVVLRDRTLWITWVCFGAAAFIAVQGAAHQMGTRAIFPAVIFFLFGAFFLRSTDALFDKAAHVLTLRRRNILAVTRNEIPFDQIQDIKVEPFVGSHGRPSCRLVLSLADGPLPLTASFEGDEERYAAVRETLADIVFAGRARPAATPLAEVAAQSGRPVDAAFLMSRRDGVDFGVALDRAEAIARDAKDARTPQSPLIE